MSLKMVEDRIAVHAAGKPVVARVTRWVGEGGVRVHKYTFYSAPNTLLLRTVHKLMASDGAQIVIIEFGGQP